MRPSSHEVADAMEHHMLRSILAIVYLAAASLQVLTSWLSNSQ